MKIKIFNLKMKKRFMRIAACLLASTSLMISVAVPGQAANGRVFETFFGEDYEKDEEIKKLLKECQDEIEKEIDGKLNTEFKADPDKADPDKADSAIIGGYKFTKKRYQHIAYGDYANGVSSNGLHMNCGLEYLKKSFKIFKKKIEEAMKKNPNFTTLIDKKKEELEELEKLEKLSETTKLTDEQEKKKADLEKTYENIKDENDADSALMHCKLIHSNVSHTSRYLFPENWGFTELKKALEIAIGQKTGFQKILDEKSEAINKNKQEIQKQLAVLANKDKDKDEGIKKQKLNDLINQYMLNDKLYGFEKKLLALRDECFPNLYGYANTNGRSVTLHIIDVGEVENGKKNDKTILVQLVTDELTKEIVTFFPLNVQNLKDGEFCIVPNEGEDYEDDKSDNANDESNNTNDKSNNASDKSDNASDKSNNASDKSDNASDKSNNASDKSDNANDKSNNATKTKIYDIFQLDEIDTKPFLRRTKFEISDKFKNNASNLINNRNMNVLRGILNKCKDHLKDGQSKKYLKELENFVDDKKQNDDDKLTNYIENAKNELESIKKVDTLDESNAGASNEKDKKLQKTQLIQKLKSEFEKLGKNTSLPQSSDENELDEAKTFMLTTILNKVSFINSQIKNANKQLENSIKNKKDDLVELRSNIDGLRKRLANWVELMQKSGIETLLLKSKDLDKCEFTQGGLDLSEEVKNLGSVDKYTGELDQLLNGLIVNDNVFSSVITLMKNKLKDNADREEKAKKAAVGKAKDAAERAKDALKRAKDALDALKKAKKAKKALKKAIDAVEKAKDAVEKAKNAVKKAENEKDEKTLATAVAEALDAAKEAEDAAKEAETENDDDMMFGNLF